MNKKIIGIIFDDQLIKDKEYDYSISRIESRIDPDKYNIILIEIKESKGKNSFFEIIRVIKIEEEDWKEDITQLYETSEISKELSNIDLFFLVLSNTNIKPKIIQQNSKILNKPFFQIDTLSSLYLTDKILIQLENDTSNIPIATHIIALKKEFKQYTDKFIKYLIDLLKFPILIKPYDMNTPGEIIMVNDLKALKKGLNTAFDFNEKIIVEEFVPNIKLF